MAAITLTIEGGNIHDIPSFYDEINRVFMAGEGWTLGQSLDAFSDLLYGGFGAIKGNEPVTLVWTQFEKNRADLGHELTREFLRNKLSQPDRYDVARIGRELEDLEAGRGPTYFEILLQIIGEHANIELVPR